MWLKPFQECTFLFWNEKVFLENFNQEVNFSSLVRYFTIIIYFLLPFPSYFNIKCMFYNNMHLPVSYSMSLLQWTNWGLLSSGCPLSPSHNHFQKCHLSLVEIPGIAPYCWPCGFISDADVFQVLSEHRYYKFPLFSSIFYSFKEQNLACF